jgi:hypothetical protein
VLPAPVGRRGVRYGDRQEPRLEGLLRAGAGDGRAEADRGNVPFTDAQDTERHSSLASAQAALVGAEHRARVAQGRGLRRVLRGEGRSQQQRARRRQLTRLFDARGDDRRMPPQERLIIVVAAAVPLASSRRLGAGYRQPRLDGQPPIELARSRKASDAGGGSGARRVARGRQRAAAAPSRGPAAAAPGPVRAAAWSLAARRRPSPRPAGCTGSRNRLILDHLRSHDAR